jgi:uncharacterized protein involved in exopolysaccharide biosynthesis
VQQLLAETTDLKQRICMLTNQFQAANASLENQVKDYKDQLKVTEMQKQQYFTSLQAWEKSRAQIVSIAQLFEKHQV